MIQYYALDSYLIVDRSTYPGPSPPVTGAEGILRKGDFSNVLIAFGNRNFRRSPCGLPLVSSQEPSCEMG